MKPKRHPKNPPKKRAGYTSDVSDEEWEFCAPYLTLMQEKAPQRTHSLRAVFDALRWFVRAGCPWRMLPNDLPPWWTVQQQTRRWIKAGCFEAMAADLRAVSRIVAEREHVVPTAAVLDSRTLQSTPESGGRAGYDGAKRRKGSKTHVAVDTLGHLLALRVTPADEQDRAQVGPLAKAVQQVTGKHVEKAFVDQGYTGEKTAAAAARHGLELEIIKHTEAKRGFILLPRRWVVERSFAWAARFRRLARDYERLASTLAGFHWLAFACLMLRSLTRQNA
jgi:transposase